MTDVTLWLLVCAVLGCAWLICRVIDRWDRRADDTAPRHPDDDYRLTRDERAKYRQILIGWIQETEREDL